MYLIAAEHRPENRCAKCRHKKKILKKPNLTYDSRITLDRENIECTGKSTKPLATGRVYYYGGNVEILGESFFFFFY